jgi:lipoate-protein ligase A
MSAPIVRLLPFESLSGAQNMAADEVLLLAAAERGSAAIRFYTWNQPTLSLGYFQAEAQRRANPLLADVAWVRRPSGGAAILHHLELTYCLALPAGAPWQTRDSWICRFHEIVAAALLRSGVTAHLVGCGNERQLGDSLCFLHQTPGDLLVADCKVAGSAQRKLRGALLQHGSILLHRSPHAPALPGIVDLTGIDIAAADLSRALADEFAARTGWVVEQTHWISDEEALRRHIAAQKYATARWNQRR